jgi:2'-5' RNA ligase
MMTEPVQPAGMARLFFAVVPDDAVRGRLAQAAGSLALRTGARPVARNNLHATLAFVGDVPAVSIDALREIGRAQTACRFAMRFDAFEFWPKPAVVVVRATEVPQPLEALWLRLHADLAMHGWAQNPKRLRPHVTLARHVAQSPDFPPLGAFDWEARDFSLLRSDTSGLQPSYTVLDTWPLLDKQGVARENSLN